MNIRIRRCVTTAVMLAIVITCAYTGPARSAGKGGGKPPNNPPASPPNPVIVYSDGDIVVANADGSNQTVVHTIQAGNSSAAWCSPDGSDLVFKDNINGQSGVYHLKVVDIDENGNRTVQVGTPELVIATNDAYWFARCSPGPVGPVGANGQQQIKVAYSDYQTAPDGTIYSNAYVTNLFPSANDTPLLIVDGLKHGFEKGIEIPYVSWSPNGDEIVITWLSASPYISDVEIIPLPWNPGAAPRSLVQGVSDSPLHESDFLVASWSNNGDNIAVESAGGIWIIPVETPHEAAPVMYDSDYGGARVSPGWSPDDSQLIYQRNPRRGMCGEGDGRNVKGNAIAISNVEGVDNPIEKDGLSCDEIAIVQSGANPNWWRGALCGNGVVGGAEACDDGNRIDGDGCSAVCTIEEP